MQHFRLEKLMEIASLRDWDVERILRKLGVRK
jgi:hypothetical protein